MLGITQAKEKKMILNGEDETVMIQFPIMETGKIMAILRQAEQDNNHEALKWGAHVLVSLYDLVKTNTTTDTMDGFTFNCFNHAWELLLKLNPAPESVLSMEATIKAKEKEDLRSRGVGIIYKRTDSNILDDEN